MKEKTKDKAWQNQKKIDANNKKLWKQEREKTICFGFTQKTQILNDKTMWLF